jgi:hypothetical protein
MGPLQTYLYLFLLIGIGVAFWLLLIGIALRQALRGLRTGQERLTFALAAGAALASLVFVVLGLVGLTLSVTMSRPGGG